MHSRYIAPRFRAAFTLVEVLVATVLTLLIMAATVTLFGSVTAGIAGSRAIIETGDRLRSTSARLVLDLRGVTAPMLPPLRPEWGLGYFEYVEGLLTPGAFAAFDDPATAAADDDTTIADHDDVLMFTTRSTSEPFIGRFGSGVRQSQVAEVAWFVRGTTLYRRVLLVSPGLENDYTWTAASGLRPFYANCDVSVRQVGGGQDVDDVQLAAAPVLVPNSLGDLTKRENRYGHHPRNNYDDAGDAFTYTGYYGFPHSTWMLWGQLGLPLLQECSFDTNATVANRWPFPLVPAAASYNIARLVPINATIPTSSTGSMNAWLDPYRNAAGARRWAGVDPISGCLENYIGPRVAEDVILTNVIGFDVKAWDPGAPIYDLAGSVTVPGDPNFAVPAAPAAPTAFGAYVNLGWNTMGYAPAAGSPPTLFGGVGHYTGNTAATTIGSARVNMPAVYDTWSTHYESDGINQDWEGDGTNRDALIDEGTNGVDNSHRSGVAGIHPATATAFFTGGMDDPSEFEAPPPYPYPLRGIQIKIRVFEPDSRQIREVTVVRDFLPE